MTAHAVTFLAIGLAAWGFSRWWWVRSEKFEILKALEVEHVLVTGHQPIFGPLVGFNSPRPGVVPCVKCVCDACAAYGRGLDGELQLDRGGLIHVDQSGVAWGCPWRIWSWKP